MLTDLKPQERNDSIKSFLNKVKNTNESKEVTKRWKIDFPSDALSVPAIRLKSVQLMFNVCLVF